MSISRLSAPSPPEKAASAVGADGPRAERTAEATQSAWHPGSQREAGAGVGFPASDRSAPFQRPQCRAGAVVLTGRAW